MPFRQWPEDRATPDALSERGWPEGTGDTARLRLAEVLTSLSLAIDLGVGMPMQTVLRTALIAVRLARAGGLDQADVGAAYYLAFLRFVGCTTTSHETSFRVGDELAMGDLLVMTDPEVMPEMTRILGLAKTAAEAQVAVRNAFATFAARLFADNRRAHCEAARLIAARLGLGQRVLDGLAHAYQRWDGQSPQRLAAGAAINLPMRVVQVAQLAAYDCTSHSPVEIAARARVRADNQLDPTFAALLAEDPRHFLAGLDTADLTQSVLAAEPGGPVWLTGDAIDTALSAIADFTDFKSPHMLGHSRRVATVAAAAARAASMRHFTRWRTDCFENTRLPKNWPRSPRSAPSVGRVGNGHGVCLATKPVSPLV